MVGNENRTRGDPYFTGQSMDEESFCLIVRLSILAISRSLCHIP